MIGYILASWLGGLAGFIAGAAWQSRFPDEPRNYFGSDAYNAEAAYWRDRADALAAQGELDMAIVCDALGMDRDCGVPEMLRRIHGLRGGRLARACEFSAN